MLVLFCFCNFFFFRIHTLADQKIRIFAVVCVVIIVGLFWYTAAKKGNSAENNDDLTEEEKVITKNLEKNDPETPREVVKFYNRIITCFYDEE